MTWLNNETKCQPYYNNTNGSDETTPPYSLFPSTVPIFRKQQTEAFFSYALND